jgi:hypothetical protein
MIQDELHLLREENRVLREENATLRALVAELLPLKDALAQATARIAVACCSATMHMGYNGHCCGVPVFGHR